MSPNLIFHVVSKRKWQEFNKGGYYNPEGSKYENGIICLKSNQLKKYINSNFKGRRQVLVLVIDKSRLMTSVKFNDVDEFYYVKDKINLDSVLDKIRLTPNNEGIFDIDVTED